MLSVPVLLALGGALLFLLCNAGMKVTHAIMGVVLGAQVSTTGFAHGAHVAVAVGARALRTLLT